MILTMHRAIGWKFTFQNVKSNQDISIPMANLPLEVQFNMEADRLATTYLEIDTQGRTSLFPLTKCQILIDRLTVLRKLQHTIHYQAGAGPIQEYMMVHNSWTKETIESIDWYTHGAGHSHHHEQRCYLIKLCHLHLPLGMTLHRWDNKYPDTCPGCSTFRTSRPLPGVRHTITNQMEDCSAYLDRKTT
jgi:hypothetical protein